MYHRMEMMDKNMHAYMYKKNQMWFVIGIHFSFVIIISKKKNHSLVQVRLLYSTNSVFQPNMSSQRLLLCEVF